ncbi:MAG: nitric oxide synthase [Oscillospiraceae bacterium]|jgi:flavodoxin|nr:nitric oxide synthase [Oscillospiraceae bacterium]
MNQVIYCTKTGNTKKLALAVAQRTGAMMKAVDEPGEIAATGTLFVGASVYGGKIDPKLRAFLQTLNPGIVKRVAVFGTAMGKHSALPEVTEILSGKGIAVSEREFFCKGRFLCFCRNRPNADDLAKAGAWAQEMAEAKA